MGPPLLIFGPAIFSGGLLALDILPAAVVAAVGNTSVEVLLPEGGRGLQLACSGGSSVPGINSVGGPPYGDFTDNGDVRPTARHSPHRSRAVPVGVFPNLTGEVVDQRGALGKILTPNGMIMKRLRNTGKPLKRSLADSCGLWEAPVEHGGHVAGRVKFSACGGCLQVKEWMLTGVSRQSEETCSKCRPRRLAGEVVDDLVGLAVECSSDLGTDELLGRDVEAVDVALDGGEQSGSWVVELSQQCGGGGGGLVAVEDLLQRLGGRAR